MLQVQEVGGIEMSLWMGFMAPLNLLNFEGKSWVLYARVKAKCIWNIWVRGHTELNMEFQGYTHHLHHLQKGKRKLHIMRPISETLIQPQVYDHT